MLGKITNDAIERRRAILLTAAVGLGMPALVVGANVGMSLRTGQIADYKFPAGIEKYIDDKDGQTLSEKAAYNYVRNTFDENKDGKLSYTEYLDARLLIIKALPIDDSPIDDFPMLIPVPYNIRNTQRNIFEALDKIRKEDEPKTENLPPFYIDSRNS